MKKTAFILAVIFILTSFAACQGNITDENTVVFSGEVQEGGIPMLTPPQQQFGTTYAAYDFDNAVYLGENKSNVFVRVGGTVFSVSKESGKVKKLVVTEASATAQPGYPAAYNSDFIYYLSSGCVRQYNVGSGLDRELAVDCDSEYVTSPLSDIYACENYVALSYSRGEKVVYRLADGALSTPFTEYEEDGYPLNIEKMHLFSDSIWWLDDDNIYRERIYDVMTGEVSTFVTKKSLRTMYEVNGSIYCMEGGIRLSRIEYGKVKTVYDFSDTWDAEKYELFILCPDGNNLWLSVAYDNACQRIIRFSLKKGEVTKEYDVSHQGIHLKDAKPWHRVINGILTVFTNGDDNDIYDRRLDTEKCELVPYERLNELVNIKP